MGGDTSVHLIPSGPNEPASKIYNTIFALFVSAKKSINILTPYLVPDEAVMELMKFCSKKGVRINIILPGKNNHPFVAAAGRSYYEDLIENGVNIYETYNTMLHAKIITVDDAITLIGSANIDYRSFKLNFELSMVVYKSKFTREVLKFINIYEQESKLITIQDIRSKKLYLKLYEGMCRTLSPVL
jgi:cardiolipin synthase